MSSDSSEDSPMSEFAPSRNQQSGIGDVDRISRLIQEIGDETFREWYHQREFEKNIREGKEYFNGPSQIKSAKRLSPSELLQCKRKIYYQQLNAPREEPPPNGLFWIGRRFEEDIALPYLAKAVTTEDEYLTNSIWVDFEVDTQAGPIQIKGSTDPVIVDEDAVPVLPTEIKTKRTVHDLKSPNKHHLAQIHAYLLGLSIEYEKDITDAAIIYGSRTHLDIRAFHIEFDPEFWEDTVLEWAGNHAVYRLDESLPPAKPEYNWECDVCDYRERCGKGSRLFEDVDATGLLPLFVYPRKKINEYLETYDGHLTPTLAHHHPRLADKFEIHDWWCRGCGSRYNWDAVEWQGDVSNPPICPRCMEHGDRRFLSGPAPENQIARSTNEQE